MGRVPVVMSCAYPLQTGLPLHVSVYLAANNCAKLP